MADLLGRIIDRKYRITRELGEGGMGTVYEAEHTLIHRKVAVKVMHSAFSSLPEAVSRFLREAQSASAIGHPNIVEIQDVGKEEDGTIFLVMELLEGQNLGDLVEEKGALPPDRVIVVILQVLSALAAAHEKGIIHRDLKPDNIYLSRNKRRQEEVKLLDFGIAKVQGALEGDQGLTKTGTVLGTPHYMSPEQARGKPIDVRIDIWAVGVMMYEMLSGQLPYPGDTYNEILSEILLETPPPLHEVVPGIGEDIVAVVEKAMSKDPDQRFSTATEMITILLGRSDQPGNMMTPSAAMALKSSVAPPPYIGETAKKRQSVERRQIDSDRRKSVSRRPPGPGRPSRRRPPQRRSRASLLVRITITIAVLLAVLILSSERNDEISRRTDSLYETAVLYMEEAIFFWDGKKNSLEDPDSQPSILVSRRNNPDKAVQDAAPKQDTLPGVLEETDSGTDAAPKNEKESSNSAQNAVVTIKVKGLVRRARVTLDKKSVEPPLKLPLSDKELLFKVTARGYRPFEQMIVPNEDKTIEVLMDKKKRRRSSRKKRKNRSRHK